ncbi:MAG: sugar nucleotide-binding protein [Bacilli bacterium]|nr:sugar nucleotide-binding protein [Bacilli bacterium]
MKVLITGGGGQLGYDVIKVLKEKDIESIHPTSIEMDITDKDNVIKVIQDYKPDLVIHCAAWTDVYMLEDGTNIILSEKDKKWEKLKNQNY